MITFVMWTSVNLVTFVCICIVVQMSMFASKCSALFSL